jgi:hypothetical protein
LSRSTSVAGLASRRDDEERPRPRREEIGDDVVRIASCREAEVRPTRGPIRPETEQDKKG